MWRPPNEPGGRTRCRCRAWLPSRCLSCLPGRPPTDLLRLRSRISPQLTSVSDLGERLAELMLTELNVDDAFKLYYVDSDGDTMLVSGHTTFRDLLYSELITAKV